MTRSWPGYLPPLAAGAGTLLATWLAAWAVAPARTAGVATELLLVALLPVPFVVSVLWGTALLAGRPPRLAVAAATGWLAVGLILLPGSAVWQMAGSVAAGLGAGLALGGRWRADAALAVVSAGLLPLLVWSALQLPMEQQLEALRQQFIEGAREALPADADPQERARALDREEQRLDQAIQVMARIFPAVLTLGMLGQAALILGLVRLVIRTLGLSGGLRRLPPFSRWRLPFYVVWILVAGIGLMVTRRPVLSTAGLNTVLVAGLLLSVQGLAVQIFLTARLLPLGARVVFWTVMGVFFAPVLLVSGAGLGLADQWLDFRKLDGLDTDDTQPGGSIDDRSRR